MRRRMMKSKIHRATVTGAELEAMSDEDPIIVRARELARAAGAEWCLRSYFAEDVEEEADESMYFLKLFLEILENDLEEVKALHVEANEIVSIIVASINTAKKKQSKK